MRPKYSPILPSGGSPKPADLAAARYQLSFWEAMIVLAAKRLRCDRIWTEDLAEGAVYEGIAVCNPFAGPMRVQELQGRYNT